MSQTHICGSQWHFVMSVHVLDTEVDRVALNKRTTKNYVGAEILRTVAMKSVFFWAVTSCSFGHSPTFRRNISPPSSG
jgi:hypothetical protein